MNAAVAAHSENNPRECFWPHCGFLRKLLLILRKLNFKCFHKLWLIVFIRIASFSCTPRRDAIKQITVQFTKNVFFFFVLFVSKHIINTRLNQNWPVREFLVSESRKVFSWFLIGFWVGILTSSDIYSPGFNGLLQSEIIRWIAWPEGTKADQLMKYE